MKPERSEADGTHGAVDAVADHVRGTGALVAAVFVGTVGHDVAVVEEGAVTFVNVSADIVVCKVTFCTGFAVDTVADASLGACACVASLCVCAVTSGVAVIVSGPDTFIDVEAVHASDAEVSVETVALVAAGGVDTLLDTTIFSCCAFIVVDTFVVNISVAILAGAFESAAGIYTSGTTRIAVVVSSETFVDVDAYSAADGTG